MDNNKLDYLIPEMSNLVSSVFIKYLMEREEFNKEIDSGSLINMTVSVFLSSTIYLLDKIKKYTIGEVELIENIELAKNALIKSMKDLPFISKIEGI